MKELVARAARRLRESPWLAAVLVLTIAFVVISPWGNYALNDDWTYAHLAKRVAETSRFHLDVPIAPNAVGQALVGGLVVKLFGFSHTILRILTFFFGCAGLYAIDRLLSYATSDKPLRLMALLLLAFNPIFFYSATTFMNELYGWVPAVFAGIVWFRSRDAHRDEGGPLVSVAGAMGAGFLAGSTFWTRQPCVLVFPALLGATVLGALLDRRIRGLVRSLPALAAATGIFSLVIWAYFVWARESGNFGHEFAARIPNLLKIDGDTYEMQAGSAFVYLTAFFLPVLALYGWRWQPRWVLDLGGAIFVLVGVVTKGYFETHATTDFWVGPIWAHRVFPFVVNIVYNAGLGPVTLDDTFFYRAPTPAWPREVWTGFEFVLIAAGALWILVWTRMWHSLRERGSRANEMLMFAALLLVGSVVAIVQAHQREVVDRYYMPLILAGAILVPGALGASTSWGVRGYDRLKFAVLFAPLALFTVLGAHDEFRWNDARWQLVRLAMAEGGTRATVQGGYEVNCWNKYEGLSPDELRCTGGCRCEAMGFCCVDDRWRIGTTIRPGYHEVASLQPSYWLASGPPLILSRRGAS